MTEVKIAIVGKQCTASGEKDSHRSINTGTYEEKDGIGIVRYTEYDDDAKEGVEQNLSKIENELRFDGTFMELSRVGNLKSIMYFKVGEEYIMDYQTPFGALELKIDTLEYRKELTPKGIKISLKYNLFDQSQAISTNSIEILIRNKLI